MSSVTAFAGAAVDYAAATVSRLRDKGTSRTGTSSTKGSQNRDQIVSSVTVVRIGGQGQLSLSKPTTA